MAELSSKQVVFNKPKVRQQLAAHWGLNINDLKGEGGNFYADARSPGFTHVVSAKTQSTGSPRHKKRVFFNKNKKYTGENQVS